ncbi:hypothetical protein [Pelagicoccus sp. SDUM812005]|uniref:hypothetical protein n=1 Tax=Pelagicoccus sp. SDUM812005 TaxID=3041257 RepID=UPI00280E2A3A|nr:hypothetical protein [Pelagicoccus sp. SDUM812005]MDQ8181545.1 hypothetical protein [Pelagicoccus sp. SDUM812005]
MPYKIIWNSSYVCFDYYGKVTSEDIVESNKEVYGDPRFDELRWELVSFDETESVAFKPANVRLIAYMDEAAARSNPYISVAFIGKTSILKEVEEAYANTGAKPTWPVFSFESREEALEYITQKDPSASCPKPS